MSSSTLLFGLLYGCVLFAILYMLFRMINPIRTLVIREEPQVIPESSWWRMPLTSYNRWPYWGGWWSGGGGGGYGPREWRHDGSYAGNYGGGRYGGGRH